MNATSIRRDDVQGNILKGHGRTYSALVFFRFGDRAASAQNRRLLRDAGVGVRPEIAITSAAAQQRQSEAHRADPSVEFPFISLALSRYALEACAYTAADLRFETSVDSDSFWDGASPALLGEAGPWEKPFTMNADGVFLVAHARKEKCVALAAAVEKALKEDYGAVQVERELGFRWKPKLAEGDDATFEHFGFADGFARTAIVGSADSPLQHLAFPREMFLKNNVEPFEIPLNQVMIEDPGDFCGGSFLVIAKLEQNVRAFLEAEAYLDARRDQLPPGLIPAEKDGSPGKTGALFIGRNRHGVPLARERTERTDRFDFGGDPAGKGCPFMAHIRKMNPRQNKMHGRLPHQQSGRLQQKSAQFVRRGVLYGDETQTRIEWPDRTQAPEKDVGMLFMGYMSRIGNQFLKMYFNWGPGAGFPQADSGADPLLGGGGKPWQWAQHPQLVDPANPLQLGQLVTSKGVGFFVVPPLYWLRGIP